MRSKRFFTVGGLLERYNKLNMPLQMILFFVPFVIILQGVFWSLCLLTPGGVHAIGVFNRRVSTEGQLHATIEQKDMIIENVVSVVTDINNGKSATDFKPNDYTPFIAIMSEEGRLLVHPVFSGNNLSYFAPYMYNELSKATVEGIWIELPVNAKVKNFYVKRTKNDLIVISSYWK